MRKLTTSIFINRSNLIHKNKYIYLKTKYIYSSDKVIITCSIHGDFKQTPSAHLNGQGCPICKPQLISEIKIYNSSNSFIKKARKVHGDIYDYSKTIYIGAHNKVIIICPVHGEFEQTPAAHLQGNGCRKCSSEKLNKLYSSNVNEFIEKAKKVHGNKYNYSKVDYISAKNKVIIICPKHGEFEQTPNNHLTGYGCSKCRSELMSILLRSNTQEFIKKAIAIHGDKYDYSKVVYVTAISKVIIICPEHGKFEQIPASHLSGNGCPICKSSKGELAIRAILLKHNIESKQEYKLPNQEELLDKACTFEYDFYLPKLNLLIEFHGIQHYKVIEFFGGEEAFEKTKLHDNRKKDLAKMAGIKLIEFNYKQLEIMSEVQFEKLVLKTLII